MGIDINEFGRMGEFSMQLTGLGLVRCQSLNTNHLTEAEKKSGNAGASSQQFLRWLLGEMARRPVEGGTDKTEVTDGARLTPEELEGVTESDLEDFADKLTQKNKFLLKTDGGDDLKRETDESACDFFRRAIKHHMLQQRELWKRVTQTATEKLFVGSTLDSLRRNMGLSDQLEDMIKKYSPTQDIFGQAAMASTVNVRPLPEISFPRNPILDTNEKLEHVANQLDDLRPLAAQCAELIRSMNDTALRMQGDYISNAQAADKKTKLAIWIAALSLVVTAASLAATSYFSYRSSVDAKVSSEQSDEHIESFRSEMRALVAGQREDRLAVAKAIRDGIESAGKNSTKK